MNSAHWPGVINNGHTTGKSIGHLRAVPPYLMSSQTSALSVVVNAQADALETAPLDEDSAISGE